MPPLFAWAIGAAGGVAFVRFAMRELRRINRELDAAREAQTAEALRTERVPRLRRDPVTGTYRPE